MNRPVHSSAATAPKPSLLDDAGASVSPPNEARAGDGAANQYARDGYEEKAPGALARAAIAGAGVAVTTGSLFLGGRNIAELFSGVETGTYADVVALPIVMAMSLALAGATAIGVVVGASMTAAAVWPHGRRGAPLGEVPEDPQTPRPA